MKGIKKRSKKDIILSLLKEYQHVPLHTVAKKIYGKQDHLSQSKVISLLAAYRTEDERFTIIRVRNKQVTLL